MNIEKDDYIDAVAKLIEMTQENSLKWESVESKELAEKLPNSKIECVFHTNYLIKKFQLYKCQTVISSIDSIHTKWESKVALDLIDNNGNTLFEFPAMSVLDDLLTSVRFQVSGVKDLIQSLTKKEFDIDEIFKGEWICNYNKGTFTGTERVNIKNGIEYYRNGQLTFLLKNIKVDKATNEIMWIKENHLAKTKHSAETLKIINEGKVEGSDDVGFKIIYIKKA